MSFKREPLVSYYAEKIVNVGINIKYSYCLNLKLGGYYIYIFKYLNRYEY